MKLVIAGSRSCNDPEIFNRAYNALMGYIALYRPDWQITEIVHGACPSGVDKFADDYFRKRRYPEIKRFPADWSKHGRKAGPLRNKEMAEYGDLLLLVWDGKSRGSRSMKNNMVSVNKFVFSYIYDDHGHQISVREPF